jgi:hypothetical protein
VNSKLEESSKETNKTIVYATEQIDNKLTRRIDNLIDLNLTIPGVIDDPEGLISGTKVKSSTLKNYILERIQLGKTTNRSITV